MNIRNIFTSLNISASGLSTQRRRMDTIARNLANVETTRTEGGGPYRREIAVVAEIPSNGSFRSILERVGARMTQTHERHMQPTYYRLKQGSDGGGVEIQKIAQDNTPPRLKYDPSHPDADANGYIQLPNINVVTEMVDMIGATRAYEANLSVIDATKKIVKKSLDI